MEKLLHLFPVRTVKSEPYTYPRQVGSSSFRLPPRDDRVRHGEQLITNVKDAVVAAASQTPAGQERGGTVLEFSSDPGFKLAIESLEFRRSGIELLNSRIVDEVMLATVFVPEGKEKYFLNKFEAYRFKNDSRSGKPRNQTLAESIQKIKLASIKSFWTDRPEHFPEMTIAVSFEVWIRENAEHRLENAKEFIVELRPGSPPSAFSRISKNLIEVQEQCPRFAR